MKRILVVDDDRIATAAVVAALRGRPWSVETCADADRAAVRLAEERWDVVLLDLELGDVSGMDLVRALRAREDAGGRSSTGVVAMTAHRDAATLQAALAAGFDGVLVKPVPPVLLREVLARFARTDTPPPRAPLPSIEELAVELSSELDAHRDAVIAALTRGDLEAVRRAAHRLTGAAGVVEQSALADVAAAIEDAAVDGDLVGARRHGARLGAMPSARAVRPAS